MIDYQIRSAQDTDAETIICILNYYVENSFAAYPDSPLPIQAFGMLKNMVRNDGFFVAEDDNGKVVGFAMLKHYMPFKSFAHSAEVSYFIDSENTGKGLGKAFLDKMEQLAKDSGVSNLFASISSQNMQSIQFHEKYGFRHCGKLEHIGRKLNEYFDIVWMQKDI
jgi:L-amino acid N-acyltransferase YncA